MRPTNGGPLEVQIGAVDHRVTWMTVPDFAAASRACREFIQKHDLGASAWRGGRIVDAASKRVLATVSYNGRVWLADGIEALLDNAR